MTLLLRLIGTASEGSDELRCRVMKIISLFKHASEEVSYLDKWMNKVSRSFAVVVAALEEPLRYYLASF
jgi:hypothetical protein